MSALQGIEELSTSVRRTQTYLVTHDGEGNSLPLMERSFMSFSYGGKNIEEFQLVATFNGRLNKNIYSEFEDSVTEYITVDGQYYWGTRMKSNMLNFTLSTDYMTQNKLEEFKMWFKPGVERPLILAEHPNRYILARVSISPSINMTPFGEEVTVILPDKNTLQPKEYKTKTTIYRGDITITFTMDEPYWRGILSYMPYTAVTNDDSQLDENVKNLLALIIKTNSLDSADALKICLEDGIPHDMNLYGISNINFGNNEIYSSILVSRTPEAATIDATNEEIHSIYPESEWAKAGQSILSYIPKGARTDIAQADDENSRLYDYALNNVGGVDLSPTNKQYLFYSGTAPSKPIISFTLEIGLDQNTGYIINPINSIGTSNFTQHSFLQVGSHKFEFTTPGICTSYNKALQILDQAENVITIEELKQQFRTKIKDKYVKNWCVYCLKDYSLLQSIGTVRESIRGQIMSFFISSFKFEYDYENLVRTSTIYYTMDLIFNSKTGESKGKFQCRTPQSPINGEEIIENVGDMVLSNYLIIDERNNLDNGIITLDNCTEISTNENITNLIISYTNMYY